MITKKLFSVISCVLLALLTTFLYFCGDTANPDFDGPDDVTVALIFPDTTGTPLYTEDSIAIYICLEHRDYINAVSVAIGNYYATLTPESDTIFFTYVFPDTGNITVTATAFLTNDEKLESSATVLIKPNPLVPPENVFTDVLSINSLKVFWNRVYVALTYNVYRSTSKAAVYVLLKSAGDSSLVDSNLVANTTYYYKVSSVNAAGRESRLSPYGAATTQGETAPVITQQPQDTAVRVNSSAIFRVRAEGNPFPSYQWQADGINIEGEVSDSLSLTDVPASLSGKKYRVVVSNSAGDTMSREAVLTVSDSPYKPVITAQPRDTTIQAGESTLFRVTAEGNPVPTYQWQANGLDVQDGTDATLILNSVPLTSSGYKYRAVVSNSVGDSISAEANLLVVEKYSLWGEMVWGTNIWN